MHKKEKNYEQETYFPPQFPEDYRLYQRRRSASRLRRFQLFQHGCK